MAQELVTFKDITDAISEALGVQRDDTNARNKIKRFINMTYLDEVAPFKRWTWLQKNTTVVHKAAYYAGTVSVTPESTTVTLSTTPNVSVGSFKNYKFSIDGSNKVYTVESHTTASTTIVLTGAYQEALNATANFKLWRDVVNLPTDAKETVGIWHSEQSKPLDACGPQGLRKFETANPKGEGFPVAYNTTDYFDPTSDDAETESDRYRQVRLYPAITSTPVTLNIDYVPEMTALNDDTDEPLIPISDRVVLVYGAGAMAWSIINRNEEMHDRWQAKYEQKLSRMAGDRDDGYDTPTMSPKAGYVNNIRRSGLKRRSMIMASSAGQSSVALPSYLKDVRIDGATLIDDMDVNDGILIDGRDISEDGDLLDGLANTTTITLTDNTTDQAAAVFDLNEYNVVHIQYSVERDTTFEAGMLTLISDGSSASIAQGAVANVGSTGVSFDVDVTGGNLRLLSTQTSTGLDATFKYRQFRWLS